MLIRYVTLCFLCVCHITYLLTYLLWPLIYYAMHVVRVFILFLFSNATFGGHLYTGSCYMFGEVRQI